MKPAFLLASIALCAPGVSAQNPSFDHPGPGPLAQVLFAGETFHYRTTVSGVGAITITPVSVPAGMTVSSSGLVDWTVGAADHGAHQVVLEAQDANGTSQLSFSLAVEPEHFTTQLLDYPGADNTQIYGTNHLGQMVGTKSAPGLGLQAFLWDGTTFTELKYPGALWTAAYDITDLGEVVGSHTDSDGWHGYRWKAGVYTPMPPLTPENHPYSSTNAGLLTGWTIGGLGSSAFAYTDLGLITYPGATGFGSTSHGFGMNEIGQAVGDYWQIDAIPRTGFLFDQNLGTTVAFSVPESLFTSAAGISDSSQIVGNWSGLKSYGTVGPSEELSFYTSPGGPANMRRLSVPGTVGRLHAMDVDNSGVIVGRIEYQFDDFHGFIATPIADFEQTDLGGASPEGIELRISGQPLFTANQATLKVAGANSGAPGLLMVGSESAPLPFAGGQLLVTPGLLLPITVDAAGAFQIPGIAGGGGPVELAVQVGLLDASNPTGFSLSNAVRVVFLP